MEVRVAKVSDQVEQANFEIYSILALGTTSKYNDLHPT